MEIDAVQEFKQAVHYLRDGHPDEALIHVRRAAEQDRNNPYYLSFLGLVLARAEQKWADAEDLCETAIRMKRSEAQFYLNLAEVYTKAGRREDAEEILNRGMVNAGLDRRLSLALSKLVIRRRPVFPFLQREHFLNRCLGKVRHNVLQHLVQT